MSRLSSLGASLRFHQHKITFSMQVAHWQPHSSLIPRLSEREPGNETNHTPGRVLRHCNGCLAGCGRVARKQGKPGIIHHVSDVRWTWRGGGGLCLNAPQLFETSDALHNFVFKIICSIHPHHSHDTRTPCFSPLFRIRNRRTEIRVGLGTRLALCSMMTSI